MLNKLGYREPKKGDPITYNQFVEAFQIHYQPKLYKNKKKRGIVQNSTVAKMKALLRTQQ